MRKTKRTVGIHMKDPILAVLEGAIIGSGDTESAWVRKAIHQRLANQGFDLEAIVSKPDSLPALVEGLRTALKANTNQTDRRCGR